MAYDKARKKELESHPSQQPHEENEAVNAVQAMRKERRETLPKNQSEHEGGY